jgi:hypothetical protein
MFNPLHTRTLQVSGEALPVWGDATDHGRKLTSASAHSATHVARSVDSQWDALSKSRVFQASAAVARIVR